MKATTIAYYITTGLISIAMLFSAYSYLAKPELKEGFRHLGFPDYFRVELAVAKIIAAIALWLPFRLPREAAYIGLAITFVSAFIAHRASGDPMSNTMAPVVMLALLISSYLLLQRVHTKFGVPGRPYVAGA